MIIPQPDSSVIHVDDKGKPTKDFYNWLKFVSDYINKNLAEYNNGSPANGSTITINPSKGLKQTITNNVAGFTIAATAELGDVELRIVNGASAGTVTFSGFVKHLTGDSLDTTNAHQFIVFIYGFGAAGADYMIKARQ